MGIQAMILALKNNKRNRRMPFDKKNLDRSVFSEFVDHKEMKTYEYAAFQKGLFREKALQKRKRIIIFIVTAVLVLLVMSLFPILVEWVLDPDHAQKVPNL